MTGWTSADRPVATADVHAAALRVSADGRRRVYARRLRTVHVAFGLIFSLIVSMGPVSKFVVGDHALAAAIACSTTAAGLLICLCILRRAIIVSPGLVTIRGLVTTTRLQASDVARFQPPEPYGKVFGRVALRVVMADGHVHDCSGFANSQLDGSAAGIAECDELNRWLALQRGSATGVAALRDRRPLVGWAAALWAGWLVVVVLLGLLCLLGALDALTDPAFGG